MSDLISRQAVLDELEKWDWQDLYLPIHFKQILDDIPSVENKVEWISVSERLPEESKNYLVIIREKFNKEHWWIDICDIDTDGFAKTWNVREPYYVEAWQPLPEPYKKECEDI